MQNFQYLIYTCMQVLAQQTRYYRLWLIIIIVTSFSVLAFHHFGEFTKYYSDQYLMIFSSGKLFRINKSLPTSVCNQGHQAMKGIELYSYSLQSNTGTSLIYIAYILSYIIIIHCIL